MLDDRRAGRGVAAALKVLQVESDNADARVLAALSHHRLGQSGRAAELLSDVELDDGGNELVRELQMRWR